MTFFIVLGQRSFRFYARNGTVQCSTGLTELVAERKDRRRKSDNAAGIVACRLGFGRYVFFPVLYHRLYKIPRKIKPYCSEIDRTVLDSVLNSMKIKGRPQFFRCSKIASPMLTGFFQAAILLPDLDYTREELFVILQHELTHYKRGDIWYNLLLVTLHTTLKSVP